MSSNNNRKSIEDKFEPTINLSKVVEEIQNEKETEEKEPIDKKKKLLFLGGITLIILLIGGIIFYLFKYGINEEEEPEINDPDKVEIEKDNYIFRDGTLVFLNSDNKEIGYYVCNNKSTELCYVALEMQDDKFDTAKNIYEDNTLLPKRSKIYGSKYVFIHDSDEENSNIFLYNFTTNEKINEYRGLKSYYDSTKNNKENNYVFVKNTENLYGIINLDSKTVETILPNEYIYLGLIREDKDQNDGKIVAKINQKNTVYNVLINYKGEKLTSLFNLDIKNYTDEYVLIQNQSNTYDVYDYKSTFVTGGYNYAKLISKYLIVIDKNNYLNFTDIDGVSLIKEKIKLHNDYFTLTNNYDENHNKITTKKSFILSLNNEILNVSVFNEDQSIDYSSNIKEGLLSKDLYKYSYYDGVLYFYSDEKKTNLIGEYKCVNKNSVSSNTTSLNNCRLASDNPDDDNDYIHEKLGSITSPIFFNRFVFIYDAPTLTNDSTIKISLYDLVQNKVRGNYKTIKFDNSLRGTATNYSSTKVIAKNKENLYGILELTSSSADKFKSTDFNYLKIDLTDEYFIANKDGKYLLIDFNGNEKTAGFEEQIRSYQKEKAVVLRTNAGYKAYKFDGSPLTTIAFKYIYLMESYFLTIDSNNKLNIVDYNGNNAITNTTYLETFSLPSTLEYGTKIDLNDIYMEEKELGKLTIKVKDNTEFSIEVKINEINGESSL